MIRTAIASLALAAAPLAAQTVAPDEAAAIQTAIDRGTLIYAYDQAAWHGSDAMVAEAQRLRLTDRLGTMIGGWIVRGSGSAPEVIFFDRTEADPHAVFRITTVDGGRRVEATHFVAPGEDGTLDAPTKALIRARRLALAAMSGQQILRCGQGNMNTVVLPPVRPGGPNLVYILAPQDTLDKVPFGGHYRVEVAADGSVGPLHAFSRSCLALPSDQAANKPAAVVATQLLDPLPTEIGVFTMFAANLPLYVVAPPDKRIWVIEASRGQARVKVVPEGQAPRL